MKTEIHLVLMGDYDSYHLVMELYKAGNKKAIYSLCAETFLLPMVHECSEAGDIEKAYKSILKACKEEV